MVAAIANNAQEMVTAVNDADLSLRSKAWNDSKVDAHHAIIPTPKKASVNALSGHEMKVYQLIARQYLMQFYPAAIYAEAKLVFNIAGGIFIAKGRQLLSAGWKVLLGQQDEQEECVDKVPLCLLALCCSVEKGNKTETNRAATPFYGSYITAGDDGDCPFRGR